MAKRQHPLHLSGDTTLMTAAIHSIQKLEASLVRKSRHQLKVGPINFYPGTGTIYLDDGTTLQASGLPVVEALLREPHATIEDVRKTCQKNLTWLPEADRLTVFL